MNTFSFLLLLIVAITTTWAVIREKRQRTVIQRTVINNYGGHGFNRQPWGYGGQQYGGGFNRGFGTNGFQNPLYGNTGFGGFNRGPFGGPPPPTVVKTTVIRTG